MAVVRIQPGRSPPCLAVQPQGLLKNQKGKSEPGRCNTNDTKSARWWTSSISTPEKMGCRATECGDQGSGLQGAGSRIVVSYPSCHQRQMKKHHWTGEGYYAMKK